MQYHNWRPISTTNATAVVAENEGLDEKAKSPPNSLAGNNGNRQYTTKNDGGFPAQFKDDEVTEKYMEGSVVKIEKFDRKKYHTELYSIPFEAI